MHRGREWRSRSKSKRGDVREGPGGMEFYVWDGVVKEGRNEKGLLKSERLHDL